MSCDKCRAQVNNDELSIENLESTCSVCPLFMFDDEIIGIYNLYCQLFNNVIPFNYCLSLYYPNFHEIEEKQAKHLIDCFILIQNIMNEFKEQKQKAAQRAHERKIKMNRIKRRR